MCIGIQSVLRLSFCLFVFYLSMLVTCMTTRGDSPTVRECYADGFWTAKLLGLCGGFLVLLWIPDEVMVSGRQTWYMDLCRYVSFGALTLQGIVLMDLSYYWNDYWTQDDRRTGEEGYWTFLALFSAGILWSISLTTCVLSYFWFVSSDCSLNFALLTATLVVGILYSLLSVTGLFENGSILCSSMVNVYSMYLCWSALASQPSSCNTWSHDLKSTVWLITFSCTVAIIALATIGLRKRAAEIGNGQVANQFLVLVDEEGKPPPTVLSDPQFTYFFVYLTLFSLYESMLLTNWGTATVDEHDQVSSR